MNIQILFYSPLCCYNPIWLSFFCETQTESEKMIKSCEQVLFLGDLFLYYYSASEWIEMAKHIELKRKSLQHEVFSVLQNLNNGYKMALEDKENIIRGHHFRSVIHIKQGNI